MKYFSSLLIAVLFAPIEAQAQQRCDTPVVIPNVRGNSTTTKFGVGYMTRTSDGTSYHTSKFGSGRITRSSDGRTYTTSKFGDGAITRGNGQQMTTSRFGSGTISAFGWPKRRSCLAVFSASNEGTARPALPLHGVEFCVPLKW